jgi:hypothetical protein
MRFISRSLVLSLALSACAAATAAVPRVVEEPSKAAGTTYGRMSEAERLAYVADRAERVARMLAANGDRQVSVTPDGVRAIKERVDRLAARGDSRSNVPGQDDLATVFARALEAAPTVSRAFDGAGVPAAYGLYIAFIESEYNDCLSSKLGSRGVFQFLPSTGEKYGLGPDDFCDLEKSAAAAARYVADRRAELPSDGAQAVLVLLSYNSGMKYIKGELLPAIEAAGGDPAGAFWSMTADPARYPLSKYFQQEGKAYVPLFFAAAIVGENPADFGVRAKPLSSVR